MDIAANEDENELRYSAEALSTPSHVSALLDHLVNLKNNSQLCFFLT